MFADVPLAVSGVVLATSVGLETYTNLDCTGGIQFGLITFALALAALIVLHWYEWGIDSG